MDECIRCQTLHDAYTEVCPVDEVRPTMSAVEYFIAKELGLPMVGR